jgi:hypothetical protein
MAYTLSNLIRDAIRYQGIDVYDIRTATGGSTTTFIDTNLEDLYGDDELKDGTVLVVRDAGGASAAPENEFSRISAYVESTNTATIATLTAAIASGDTVELIQADYPLRILIELANDALRDCGEISGVYSSTTTLEDATEYTIPVAYKKLTGIFLQTNSSDSDDNEWEKVPIDHIIPAAANTAATLVLKYPLTAGYTLQFVYDGFHPVVSAYNSYINEAIAPPLAALMLADKIMQWHGVNDNNMNYANKIQAELAEAKRTYPVRRTRPQTTFLHWEDS